MHHADVFAEDVSGSIAGRIDTQVCAMPEARKMHCQSLKWSGCLRALLLATTLGLLVVAAVNGTISNALAQQQTSETSQEDDSAGRPVSASERRAIIARLNLRKAELKRELDFGHQVFARAMSRWTADDNDAALKRLFDPNVAAQTPYEQKLKRYVKEWDNPWPGSTAALDFQSRYVACVQERIDELYSVNSNRLENAIETVQAATSGYGQVATAVRQAVLDTPNLEKTKCPRPQGGAQFQVATRPLSVEWDSKCLQSDRIDTQGATALYQPTAAALMYDNGRKGYTTYCSGTLIAPNAVLTAAHCVCETTAKDARGQFFKTARECTTGRYARLGRAVSTLDPAHHRVFLQHSGLHRIDRVALHPNYRWTGRLPHADLAILFLKDSVLDVQPASINLSRRLPANIAASSVGYGAHNPIDDSGRVVNTNAVIETAGLKLQSQVITNPCGFFERSNNLICWKYGRQRAGMMLGSTCRGDSGGPLYAEQGAASVLVGVTSAGGKSCRPGTVAYDTEVFAHKDWIISQVGSPPGRPISAAARSRTAPRQLACSFCTMCEKARMVTIPPAAHSLRVSVNCTPDGYAKAGELSLTVSNAKDREQTCVDAGSGTALSCKVAVEPNQNWMIDIKAGLLQQCQIVATILD
jgi:hypothetical protein